MIPLIVWWAISLPAPIAIPEANEPAIFDKNPPEPDWACFIGVWTGLVKGCLAGACAVAVDLVCFVAAGPWKKIHRKRQIKMTTSFSWHLSLKNLFFILKRFIY